MISGKAVIECGMGTTVGTYGVQGDTGTGAYFMKSCEPRPIGSSPLRDEEWNRITNDPEIVFYFHNIESLDSVLHSLNSLREMMVEKSKED